VFVLGECRGELKSQNVAIRRYRSAAFVITFQNNINVDTCFAWL